MCACLGKHSCARVWENIYGRVFEKTLVRACLGKHTCANVWEDAHARVFGKTLMRAFQISHSRAERSLFISRNEMVPAYAEGSPVKKNCKTY